VLTKIYLSLRLTKGPHAERHDTREREREGGRGEREKERDKKIGKKN